MNTLKENKIKILMGVIILALIAVLSIFGQETIEEYKTRIKTLETQITEKEKENKELSLLLEEKSEEKDIEIKEYFKSGKIKKSKVIKTKKDNKKQALSKKESTEKEKTKITKRTEIEEEKKIHKNPKRLTLGIGPVSSINPGNLDLGDLKPEIEVEARYKLHKHIELQGRMTPFNGDPELEIGLKFIWEF